MNRYDQAQLASSALDFAQLSEEEGDRRVCFDLAADILEYSMRDLLAQEGAFFGAEDADSAPRPGAKKSGKLSHKVIAQLSWCSVRGSVLHMGQGGARRGAR